MKLLKSTAAAAVLFSTLMAFQPLKAQEVYEEITVEENDSIVAYSITGAEKKLIGERIASRNTEWKKVELNGRVLIDVLPVKPSIKIYMEQGKQLLISVRAPLIGEAARIEITPEEVVGINKNKQTYFKTSPKSVLDADPNIISELQAIFLGRVALPGYGEFKMDQLDKIDILQNESDSFMVVPTETIGDGIVNFGYSVSVTGLLEELVGMYKNWEGYLNLSYDYAGEKMQIKGEYVDSKPVQRVTLQFDAPNWEASGFSRMKIPASYRQVGFRELLKLY